MVSSIPFPPFRLSWTCNLFQGILQIRSSRYTLFLPFYPILLLVLHGMVFAITFPRLDLPIADDANYFGNGKILARGGDVANADWSPLLLYMNAILYQILPLSWKGLFLLYSFLCRLILLEGIYALIARFTEDRRWAFFSTILAGICFSYWMQMNGRAFANGSIMLLLAWMWTRRGLDFFSVVGLTAWSYLIRPESILLCAGIGLYSMAYKISRESWYKIWLPSRSSGLILFTCLLCWLPIFYSGKLSTNRLTFAFEQSIQSYIVENDLLESYNLPWSANWKEVSKTIFPPEKQDRDSFWGRTIPLYRFMSANPAFFREFLWNNLLPFLGLEFPLCKSPVLSKLLNFYLAAGFFLFFFTLLIKQNWKSSIPLLWVSSIFVLSLFPCLITRPVRDYIFPATIWFFLILPYFVWNSPRFRKNFLLVGIGISLFFQCPEWVRTFRENEAMPNRHRAELLQTASLDYALKEKIVAEAYPVFCTAFHDELGRSVHYDLVWNDAGQLRAYGEKGILVDYVLLEATPPKHLLTHKKRLQTWIQRWGEKIAESNRYSLWKVHHREIASPGQLVIADDPDREEDRSGSVDEDDISNRQIVLYWNFGLKNLQDVHLYVAVDEQEFTYLGRAGSPFDNRFIWETGRPHLSPEYQKGPQFDHNYRFRIYGIPPDHSSARPLIIQSSGSIQYREAPPKPDFGKK